MYNLFTPAFQIADDANYIKESAKFNSTFIDRITLNNKNVELPIAYDNKININYGSIEFTHKDTKNIFLEVRAQGEICFFYNQKAIGSIDYGHQMLFLDPLLSGSNKIKLDFEFHLYYQEVIRSRRLNKTPYPLPTISEIRSYTLDRRLYQLGLFLEEILRFLYEKGNEEQILNLRKALNKLDFEGLKEDLTLFKVKVEEIIKKFSKIITLEMKNELTPSDLTKEVTFIGNSHLDLLFKWNERATIAKNERTNSNFYSNYHFDPTKKMLFSQSYLYKYMVEDYPYQIDEFKEMVEAGSLELISAPLTEFDTNIPSPNSIKNNIKLGIELTKKLFNNSTDILFLPDTFGYSEVLPDILGETGIKTMVTTKLLWNEVNAFPHTAFIWEGKKNSILGYKCDRGYGGKVSLWESIGLLKKSNSQEILYLYGEGDGGGGPSINDLLTIGSIKEFIPLIKITNYSFSEFTKSISKDNLERVKGELYLEKHRGVYTTGNKLKKMLFELETLEQAYQLENFQNSHFLHSEATLEKIQTFISYLSFHDTISGTMIESAYKDIDNKYQELIKELGELPKVQKHLTTEPQADISKLIEIKPQFKVYNDRAGYFDSWDISSTFKDNLLSPNIIKGELETKKIISGDFEITSTLRSVPNQKLIKLSLFPDSSNFDACLCDLGLGVIKRELTNNHITESSKFEFPHGYFVAFPYEGGYIGVITSHKYGSSYLGEYELTLLKTGIFPHDRSEELPEEFKVWVTYGKTLKDIRLRAKEYLTIPKVVPASLLKTPLSLEYLEFSKKGRTAYLLNNSFDCDFHGEVAGEVVTVLANSFIRVEEEFLNKLL